MAGAHKTTDKSSNQKDTSMTTAEAGRKGGQETAKRGPEFYSEIGSQQGKENNPGNFANRPKDEVRAAAAEGGHHSHDNDNRSDSSSGSSE